MRKVNWLWKKWLKIARIIGNFQGQVFLSILYIILFWPLAIIFKFFLDPLGLNGKARSNFSKWEHTKESLEEARRQY